MKQSIIYMVFILSVFNCKTNNTDNANVNVNDCIEPVEVKQYIELNLKNSTLILEKDLNIDWKDFMEGKNSCPTMLDYDFTNNGEKDFICMIRDEEGLPYLVAFNDYKTPNIGYHIIEGVADYGEYGIGNIIYLAEENAYYYEDDGIGSGKLIYLPKNQKAFYSKKLESSAALIFWRNGKYEIRYVED